MFGGGADTMGTAASLRTIVECEQMLSCVARCMQQKIRLTRSLGFNGDVWLWNSKSRMRRADAKNASEKRINHAITPLSLLYDVKWRHDNAPLVTRRKCSSATEYVLSWEQCKSRFIFSQRYRDHDGDERDHPLTGTTYLVLCSSSCNSPT